MWSCSDLARWTTANQAKVGEGPGMHDVSDRDTASVWNRRPLLWYDPTPNSRPPGLHRARRRVTARERSSGTVPCRA